MKKALDFLNENISGGVVIACSGGPDSMALFDLLLNLRKQKNINIVCAHVNHKKRIESNAEALMVEKVCRNFDVPFELLEINDYSGSNFEAEAREKRYNFFEKVLEKYGYKYLVTAHHGDDLMETILYRIGRGSSLRGYSGFDFISKRDNYTILRPLIWYSKDEIMDYVNNKNLEYAIDSSNASLDFVRNRFRHIVLPVYKEINEDSHLKFLQFSSLIKKYDDFIENYVDKIYGNIVNDYINIELLLKEDELIIDSILYKYLFNIYNENINLITNNHIELIKSVIRGDKKNTFVNLPLNTFKREYNKFYLKKDVGNSYEFIFDEKLSLPNGMMIKKVDFIDNNSNFVCRLNSDEIKLPLVVRTRKNGDRMDIKNSYEKKVSDIFIDSKIVNRDSFPIVLDSSGKVLWLPGLKKSKLCKTNNEKYDIILLYCGEEYNEQ